MSDANLARQLSDGERIAVQEAMSDVFREDVRELKDALNSLSRSVQNSANQLGTDIQQAAAQNNIRITNLENGTMRVKAFAAGIAFAFSLIGWIIGIGFEWIVHALRSSHSAG